MILTRRLLTLVAMLAALPLTVAMAQSEQQTLVDRATLVVQETIQGSTADSEERRLLRKARAVMVCPRIFRASFIIGGSGGGCALLARDGNGNWSYPAFYGMGSGSVGFQIGIQDSAILMMIMTDKGLGAIMDSQFKFGADANVTVATISFGVEGATTADLGADIVAFSQGRGLFAGIALQGSLLNSRTEWNHAYYGSNMGGRQIVMEMTGRNPGAEPLREVLSRNGASTQSTATTRPMPADAPATPTNRAVRSQSLSPPQR
ncbi:MAG: hypothetical protein EXR05_01265 [Acetobacteraceae bacterium]|nr:hypothetical protein [Acetobacteraceae bacterium]MSP29418.1 hypothetical protein [Acetobacteraceae bacterium]